MNKNDDSLRNFIAGNKKLDLPKPANEWREIVGRIETLETKKGWPFLGVWIVGPALAAGLIGLITFKSMRHEPLDLDAVDLIISSQLDPEDTTDSEAEDLDFADDYLSLLDAT
jgi:hypothetical protein